MEKENVVVRFCGDSGDGMQLTGNMFASLSAIIGEEISTLPDYPAEIRSPQGTLNGVSGFQINIGSDVTTPGDKADVVVAMNVAALKVCSLGSKYNVLGERYNESDSLFKSDAVIIIDSDSLNKIELEKALYKTENPFTELGLPESVQIIPIPITALTKESLSDSGLDVKSILKSRNMFALGVICWLFDRSLEKAISFLEAKFARKLTLAASNVKVLTDGYNYGNNVSLNISQFIVSPSHHLEKGTYTSIVGNKATAWGLIAASEKSGKSLFLGGYPITPATDIMQELALRKDLGVKVMQTEDEIAGICTAIGASFAGDLASTCTSGPGLSLKSEGLGLAVMAELPLVVIDVQRGGPSTGLPTKTEQTDLMQALYGRNGECPLVVLAASTPSNCFYYAYEAAKIALENMTPVILLTDTYLANGSSLWKIPKLEELPSIHSHSVSESLSGRYNVALRDGENIRYWAYPGMEGFVHRNMGLERDAERGTISTNPANHEKMVLVRKAKVEQVAKKIPLLTIQGNAQSDTLLIGWGSTEGHLYKASEELGCALVHFNYIHPLPLNTEEVFRRFRTLIVCELNTGQFAGYLRSQYSGLNFHQYNEITGQPFSVRNIVNAVKKIK